MMESTPGTNWPAAVMGALHVYQQQSFLCDYTLSSNEGDTFEVHLCVLAAASPPLYAEIAKCESSNSSVLNCSTQGLQSLVAYMYTGVFDVQALDSGEITSLMGLLNLPPVVPLKCEKEQFNCGATVKDVPTSLPTEENGKDLFIDKTGTIVCEVTTPTEIAEEVCAFQSNHLAKSTSDDLQNELLQSISPVMGEVDIVPKIDHDYMLTNVTSPTSKTLAASAAAVAPTSAAAVAPTGQECGHESDRGSESDQPEHSSDEGPVDCISPGSHLKDADPTTQSECENDGDSEAAYLSKHCGIKDCHEETCAAQNGEPSHAGSVSNELFPSVKARKTPKRKAGSKRRPHRCTQCGKKLSTFYGLQIHVQAVHEGVKDFGCEVCGKQFFSKQSLLGHQRTHTGDKPFKCMHCSRGFTWDTVRHNHQLGCKAQFADLEESDLYTCSKCDKAFTSEVLLRKHQKRIHARQPFSCDACGKTLTTLYGLKIHVQAVHEGVKEFACEVCGKQFFSKQSLLGHRRTHSGDKPFKCKHCSRGFTWDTVRQNHQLACKAQFADLDKLEESNLHTCSKCDKAFTSEFSLRKHQKRIHAHDARQLFSCDACGKMLTTLYGLKIHVQAVHEAVKEFACEVCGKQFFSKQSLIGHRRTHSGDKPFKCKHCSKCFTWETTRHNHELECQAQLVGKRPEELHACSTCDKAFVTEDLLCRHTQVVHTSTPESFPCDICGKALSSRSNLKLHRNAVHERNRNFICEVCSMPFGTKPGLVAHASIHTGEKPFECKYCSKRFRQKTVCGKHEKRCKDNLHVYDNEGNHHTCSVCQKTFINKKQKDLHDKHHHSNEPRCICTQCGKSFLDQNTLKLHVGYSHSGEAFPCPVCDKVFNSKCHLKEHRWYVHDKVKNYLCSICGKACARKSALKTHEQTHSVQDKTFSCTLCEKSFATKHLLKSHTRLHSSDYPYKCSFCAKCFKYKQSVQKHEARHLGERERPFKCDLCDKAYLTKDGLSAHNRSHTGERPYRCSVCPATYVFGGKLKEHQLVKHGIDVPVRKFIPTDLE